MSPRLRKALLWWLFVLTGGVAEKRSWKEVDQAPVHLFCDAAGDPARLAAVLWCDGKVFYTDCAPPDEIMQNFARRADQQIMGLELLSIALGMSTFTAQCSRRRVVVHSDNTGAEAATAKGTAKQFDHCHLVHEMWTHAVMHHMALWVVRVATDVNIADAPSRFDYKALEAVGAVRVRPLLDGWCWASKTWTK